MGKGVQKPIVRGVWGVGFPNKSLGPGPAGHTPFFGHFFFGGDTGPVQKQGAPGENFVRDKFLGAKPPGFKMGKPLLKIFGGSGPPLGGGISDNGPQFFENLRRLPRTWGKPRLPARTNLGGRANEILKGLLKPQKPLIFKNGRFMDRGGFLGFSGKPEPQPRGPRGPFFFPPFWFWSGVFPWLPLLGAPGGPPASLIKIDENILKS